VTFKAGLYGDSVGDGAGHHLYGAAGDLISAGRVFVEPVALKSTIIASDLIRGSCAALVFRARPVRDIPILFTMTWVSAFFVSGAPVAVRTSGPLAD